jgi:hypothetical protein
MEKMTSFTRGPCVLTPTHEEGREVAVVPHWSGDVADTIADVDDRDRSRIVANTTYLLKFMFSGFQRTGRAFMHCYHPKI